ncbi:MAG: class I SAM-dependent methyltransferase [Candidatus Promineifilaceae bacterium]
MWLRLVQFGFHLLYNQFAWTYDLVSGVVSLGEWRRWQFAVLPYVQGDAVLEIAHGTGHLLPMLQQAGRQTIGIDFSPFMGRIARQRTTAPLVRASAFDLPFAAEQFDTIITTFPTNFILDLRTLQTIERCLKPNGRLLIVPEGRLLGETRLHRLIGWLFYITGQQSGSETTWDVWQAQFALAQLDLMAETVQHARSVSTVLIASKL